MDKLPSLAHARMVEIYYQILDEPWPLQKLGWIWLELGGGCFCSQNATIVFTLMSFPYVFSSQCLSSYLVWVTWNSHINYHKFQDLPNCPNFDVPFPSFFRTPCPAFAKELRYIKRERDEFHEAYPTVPDSGSRVGSFGIGLSSALHYGTAGREDLQALWHHYGFLWLVKQDDMI